MRKFFLLFEVFKENSNILLKNDNYLFFMLTERHFKICNCYGIITQCQNFKIFNNFFLYDTFQKSFKNFFCQSDLLINMKR